MDQSEIVIRHQGVVYQNPKPYLKAIHAWHPSVVEVEPGHLLASFDLGEAVESLNYRTYLSDSTDGGKTWSEPRRWCPDVGSRCQSHSIRLSRMRDGTLVGMGGRFFRDNPEEGLVNRSNMGYVEMTLFTIRSHDGGRTWDSPVDVEAPLVGPGFEMCHRIVELSDGRWLFPTSTWRGWNGDCPNGLQAIALVSHDRGQSWQEWISVVDEFRDGRISWEQGLTELTDGRLLSVIWSVNLDGYVSLPNRFAISKDKKTFGKAQENGLEGETSKILTLSNGLVLCVYRRLDLPGLWANLVKVEKDQWINVKEKLLWKGPLSGMLGNHVSGDELSALKFGYPTLTQLSNGDVFVVFWCFEEGLYLIRGIQLAIKE